jgi:rhodanese-related sulfurtransferase
MKNKALYLLFGIISSLIVISCSEKTKIYNSPDELIADFEPGVEMITVEDLHTWVDTGMILLIDVREPGEYKPGFIPGSVNIPRGILEFKITKDQFWEDQFLYPPLKEEPIVLICKKGHRSILAVDAVKKMGFQNVKVLKRRIQKWELTYPLEQDKIIEEHHDSGGEVGGC